MRVPTSTYRLQLNADFPLSRLRDLIDYFRALGVGDLYFSPIFQARPKSPHGYDVTNPAQFNREVCNEEEFEALSRTLRDTGIGLVLDIVPNHMAASEENPWWRDILEHGACSLASHFFDVEWDAPGCDSRVVLPILGRELKDAIEAGELKVEYRDGELVIDYMGRKLPVDPATYGRVLRKVRGIDETLPAGADIIRNRRAGTPDEKAQRRNAGLALKQQLFDWASSEERRAVLQETLANLARSDIADLIEAQPYQLEFWRSGTRRINYRRFFDITDLAGVRVEDPAVFLTTHSLILQLISTDQIDGVRVDHIDGLRNPGGYLQDLRRAIGDTYVVVEKILAPNEELREDWPIEGTTGYDFIGLLAGFFCEPDGLSRISEDYARRTGAPRFADIVYDKKKFVMDALFNGELRALTSELSRLAEVLDGRLDEATLRACIVEVTASLEVYRTYITDEVDNYDRSVIKAAVNSARHRAPSVPDEAYQLFKRVLFNEDVPPEAQRQRAEFIANWQQFTGPVMAKGLEDTAFYSYNRLIALSEVGAHPDAITASVSELHEKFAKRARRWPYTMNASSTHDTKRSEDVRARIEALTELPKRWTEALDRWTSMNAQHKRSGAPDINEEIMIYQTLLGVWPLHESERASLPDRMHAFLQKSVREAKTNSSWIEPNEQYEKALFDFTDALLEDQAFLADFAALQERTAWLGALNSLAQLVLKIAAPGIPDIYQGNESWIYSLVDPDNRRPVDFERLQAQLQSLPDQIEPRTAPELLQNWRDGRIKMHITRTGLIARREKIQLFANGEYIPVSARGKFSRNIVAFARRWNDEWVLAVTGRFYSQVSPRPLGTAWGDTQLELPAEAPRGWRNILTGEKCDGRSVECMLKTLPVALLSGPAFTV